MFNELLDSMGVLYEAEAIRLNGDGFVLIDALVASKKIAFEIDGQSHSLQSRYDAGRDAWLFRVHGIRTIRIENRIVLREPTKAIEIVTAILLPPESR